MNNPMEQSPFWEANIPLASEDISPNFMEPEVSLPHSKQPAASPYPVPDQYDTRPPR
jgi:hypothetical protein